MKFNNKKNNKKGFTLTELIIVIVIIGILAAVLIPSLTGYIKKAKRSNDVQLAGEMTKAIELYAVEYEVEPEDLLGTDVKTICVGKGFDLEPRSDKWTFVYDLETHQVKVEDLITLEFKSDYAAFSMKDPTQFSEKYCLIGKGENLFEQIINNYCNFSDDKSVEDTASLITKFKQDTKPLGKDIPFDGLTAYIEKVVDEFNPERTAYVTNASVYIKPQQLQDLQGTEIVTKLVWTEGTTNLPKTNFESKLFASTAFNYKSALIKSSEKGSALKVIYPKVDYVDESQLRNIEINYELDSVSKDTKVSIVVSDLINEAISQSFTDEIISIELQTNEGLQEIVTIKKFTVSYYNGSGVFARGSVTYTTTQPYTPPVQPQP